MTLFWGKIRVRKGATGYNRKASLIAPFSVVLLPTGSKFCSIPPVKRDSAISSAICCWIFGCFDRRYRTHYNLNRNIKLLLLLFWTRVRSQKTRYRWRFKLDLKVSPMSLMNGPALKNLTDFTCIVWDDLMMTMEKKAENKKSQIVKEKHVKY